jgi:L-ascorbate metabolism protein UlaG (beta-lactamase superfamily)
VRVTKFTHSCLRVENGDSVLVVDPGGFSERAALTGADAVLITHEHFDHLDVDALSDALTQQPGMRIYTHADVLPKLAAVADMAEAVTAGQTFTAADSPYGRTAGNTRSSTRRSRASRTWDT